MEKTEARRQIREALDRISEDDYLMLSEQIVEHILMVPEFTDAGCVMLFASLPDEFDTTSLIDAALLMSKVVTLPRVNWRERELDIVRIHSLSDVEEGYMGILESRQGEEVPVSAVDFILVPGLAFDYDGHRLGRGGGYYDRLLARPGCRAVRCAAVPSLQLVDHVPHEPHDQPIDMLVTEEGVLRFTEDMPRPSKFRPETE